MGLRLNKEIAHRIAEGLASGLRGTDAYLLARPHVSRQSAAALAPLAKRDPEVRKHVERLMGRAETVGILQREEIQRILSLVVVSPKDAESLNLPENAWLITSDATTESESGSSRRITGISPMDAIRELNKISGNYSPQLVQVQHGGTIKTLSDAADYAEMLAQEAALAQAFSGRLSENAQVEAVDQEKSDYEFDALSLDWMDEME